MAHAEKPHGRPLPIPNLLSRDGFDVDGVEFKVRHDFGGGWIDHRSWYKNPGA